MNTTAQGPFVMPEVVDLERASAAFRRFYHLHFVDTIPILRGDEDWGFAKALTPEELALARRLVRANLHLGSLYGDSAAVLNDREAIPVLHDLLGRAGAPRTAQVARRTPATVVRPVEGQGRDGLLANL